MKSIKMGLALAVASVLAVPAANAARPATEYDVCINAATDARLVDNGDAVPFSAGDIVTAVGIIVPAGTIIQGAVDQSCASYAGMRIGTFMANVQVIGGLPAAEADDLAYVDWHFRINGKGAFDTTGPVKNLAPGGTYPQTITGGTGVFTNRRGTLKTTVLENGGFQIRVTLNPH